VAPGRELIANDPETVIWAFHHRMDSALARNLQGSMVFGTVKERPR
jgi:hypothetical protein